MRQGGVFAGAQAFAAAAGPGGLWRFALLAAIATGVAAQPGAGPAPASTGARQTVLRGISSSQTFSQINRNDFRAAMKAWFDTVARQKGYLADSSIDIVDSMAEARARLQKHSVELVTLSVPDYLELEGTGLLTPLLTDVRNGQKDPLYSFVLLVNPASGIDSIGGLRGKRLLGYSRIGSNTGIAWIDVVLGREKLGRASSFFGSMRVPEKAQACILPLFFGTADACVVDEISLKLAVEMNPQLATLRVLARSQPLIENLIAMPVEPFPLRRELADALLSLHEEPRGRQLLMIFRTDRLVRLRPSDLEAARDLWKEYYRLPGSQPNRPPLSVPAPEGSRAGESKERY